MFVKRAFLKDSSFEMYVQTYLKYYCSTSTKSALLTSRKKISSVSDMLKQINTFAFIHSPTPSINMKKVLKGLA